MKTSKTEKLLHNSFLGSGKWGIPIILKQDIDLEEFKIIGFHNTKLHDNNNYDKTVHFFIDDSKFANIYSDPSRQYAKLSQYKQVMCPDFSAYTDMQPCRQIESITHSYYCGACWQSLGLKAIATAAWSDENSFGFCFDGIDEGATVAVSTMQTKRKFKEQFMYGFEELCKTRHPEKVICYGKPFNEMYRIADILYVPHEGNTKRKQLRQHFPGQLKLFDMENENRLCPGIRGSYL